MSTDAWPAALPFFTVGFLITLAFLIRAALGRSVVTVFGRRSRMDSNWRVQWHQDRAIAVRDDCTFRDMARGA
jgi:hypothetical protein